MTRGYGLRDQLPDYLKRKLRDGLDMNDFMLTREELTILVIECDRPQKAQSPGYRDVGNPDLSQAERDLGMKIVDAAIEVRNQLRKVRTAYLTSEGLPIDAQEIDTFIDEDMKRRRVSEPQTNRGWPPA